MKKFMMAAVALICMTCVSMVFTSCSNNDDPVIQDETKLSLVDSDFSRGHGIDMTMAKNMIHYGDFKLFFKTNKPVELKQSDFTVQYETDGAIATPNWPLDLSDEPKFHIWDPFLNSDDQWVVSVTVFLGCMVQGQVIDFKLYYKGQQVGEPMKVEYVKPFIFEYEGSADGYLYVGQTYPIKVEGFTENLIITADDIMAAGIQGMDPLHRDEFEVDLDDDTDLPYVKILDTFTFTDEEKAAGYALICPMIWLANGRGKAFQVVPVKVPAN